MVNVAVEAVRGFVGGSIILLDSVTSRWCCFSMSLLNAASHYCFLWWLLVVARSFGEAVG